MTVKAEAQAAYAAWCAEHARVDAARDTYSRAQYALEKEYAARFEEECDVLHSAWQKMASTWDPTRFLAGQHEASIRFCGYGAPPFDYLVSWTVIQRNGRKHTTHSGEAASVALAAEAAEAKLVEIRACENVAKIAACGHPRDGIIDGVCPWCKLKEVSDAR